MGSDACEFCKARLATTRFTDTDRPGLTCVACPECADYVRQVHTVVDLLRPSALTAYDWEALAWELGLVTVLASLTAAGYLLLLRETGHALAVLAVLALTLACSTVAYRMGRGSP